MMDSKVILFHTFCPQATLGRNPFEESFDLIRYKTTRTKDPLLRDSDTSK